jgi:hypothetical protein
LATISFIPQSRFDDLIHQRIIRLLEVKQVAFAEELVELYLDIALIITSIALITSVILQLLSKDIGQGLDLLASAVLQPAFAAMKEMTATYAVAASETLKGKTFLTMTFVAGEAVQRDLSMALDVLCEEPPRPDHPLLRAQNCTITPHIAWATRAARQRLLDIAVANVRAFLRGKPQNVVTR